MLGSFFPNDGISPNLVTLFNLALSNLAGRVQYLQVVVAGAGVPDLRLLRPI
jgi:hypothetical protein